MESSDAKRTTSIWVPSFSKYPILVGTFAFGAPQLVIEEAVKLLNSPETRIRFKNLPRVTEYPHKNALGMTFMDSDPLLEICENMLKQHPECQIVIGIYPFRILEGRKDTNSVTASDLENDLFAMGNDPRTCSVISLWDLDAFAIRAARPLRVALAALMLSEIATLLYHYDPETEHRTSQACFLDYCDTKEEIIPSLVSLSFCETCEYRILGADLGKDLLKLADWLRSPPWYQDQPVVFWSSIPMLALGIGLLLLGSLVPNISFSEDFKLLSSILIPLGGFFLGLSRAMKKP